MNTVTLLVGNIASGKSTYAKHLAKQGQLVVNDDSIVMAVHGGNYDKYDPNYKPFYKSLEHVIIGFALSMGKGVVIDSGHLVTVQGRRRFIDIARSFDARCVAVEFPSATTSEIHAQRRHHSDARGKSLLHWNVVAKKFWDDYQEPQMFEGFTSIQRLTYEQLLAYL